MDFLKQRENSCLHYLNASPFHRAINWLFDHRQRCGMADKAEVISKVAQGEAGRTGGGRPRRWDSAADEIKRRRSQCEAPIAAVCPPALKNRGSGGDLIPPSGFLTSFLPGFLPPPSPDLLPVSGSETRASRLPLRSHLVPTVSAAARTTACI